VIFNINLLVLLLDNISIIVIICSDCSILLIKLFVVIDVIIINKEEVEELTSYLKNGRK